VDTLLLLRPTDSPTLFLQQLGRGLRRAPGKEAGLVLDFVGQHHQRYRLDRRYRALLGGSRRGLVDAVEQGFPLLPAGCHLELDRVARERVLEGVRSAVPSRWPEKVEELRGLRRDLGEVSLGAFLEEAGFELEDVYAGGRSWSGLLEGAGAPTQGAGPEERALRRGCGRLLHVDDPLRLEAYAALVRGEPLLERGEPPRRLARMFLTTLVGPVVSREASLEEGLESLRGHPQVLAERAELLEVLAERVDHVHQPLGAGLEEVPLRIHGRYSRGEILAAFGQKGRGAKVPSGWQAGVYWARDVPADLLAFTLDKSGGGFSPTTMYRDYAISRELIHWESQARCREGSATGRRYQEHQARGSHVMLFAQPRPKEAYWFLGPGRYVRHVGERPMAITWRLEVPLPGDLFTEFRAVAG